MKYDFIGIRYAKITGVKNPLFTAYGTIKIKNYNFKLVDQNNNNINYSLEKHNKDDFHITCKLNKGIKRVNLYCIDEEGNKYLITSIKSNISRRVYRKSKTTTKKAINYFRRFLKFFIKIPLKIKAIIITILKGIRFLWREHHFIVPPRFWKMYWRHFIYRIKQRSKKIAFEIFDKKDYNEWIKRFEVKPKYRKQEYEPLISILIPVYNINKEYLSECLDSILNQYYENFEVCLVDDCSTLLETRNTLEEYKNKDSRIKVKYRKENGHISLTTNDALKMAKGEFVALMDDDDVLPPYALSEVVKVINKDKEIDFIYSDEDKLDLDGERCEPHFKPDWSPDTLLSTNYMSHFGVIRKSLMVKVGGEEKGLEGAQDYDLYLKVTEQTDKIYHIPQILYHWRKVEGSTSMTIDNKGYALQRTKTVIENALKRRNISGHAEKDDDCIYYRVVYDLKKEPLVSIIIPTKDYASTLKTCLDSLYKKTKYKNYEVIIVNNNSEKEETFKLLDNYKKKYKNFRVLDANYEFNYSRINNEAVKIAKGEYICLLNNDTEVIDENWLNVMVGYASQKHIGAVGPKLLYPDGTVQHAGIILGLGGVASHAFIDFGGNEIGHYGRLRVPYNYSGVTAACLVISKDKFNEVGGLEENLKVAYNDVDFNIKLLKKGYYNVCTPQVKMYHYESKSRGLDTTSEKLKRFNKEQKYMYDHWGDLIKNDPYYNINLFNRKGFTLPVNPEEKRNDLYKIN